MSHLPAESILDVVGFVDFNSLVALKFSHSLFLRTICANESALAQRLRFQITISFGSITLQEESGAIATTVIRQGRNCSILEVLDGASTAIGFHHLACVTFTVHSIISCRLALAKVPALKYVVSLVLPQHGGDISAITSKFLSLKHLTLTHIKHFPDAELLHHLASLRLRRLELSRSSKNTLVPLYTRDEESLMSYVLGCGRTGTSTTIIVGDGFFLREDFAIRLTNEIVNGQQGISAEFKTARRLEMDSASYHRQNVNVFTRFVSKSSAVWVDVGVTFPYKMAISSDVQVR